jgi:rRNA maturation endonuclease Nob1
MFKCQCRKCEKIWYGWAQTDICPDCGGQLEEIETNNKKQNEQNKMKLSQTRS